MAEPTGGPRIERGVARVVHAYEVPLRGDAGILRKLETLDGIYSKFSELAANRRLEVLE